MEQDLKLSTLENIIIQIATPADYLLTKIWVAGSFKKFEPTEYFREYYMEYGLWGGLVKYKEEKYKKLINTAEKNSGSIPHHARELYEQDLCGKLMCFSYDSIRKRRDNSFDSNIDIGRREI